jgi:CHAT domain-containing protein/Flp pilus assembly protein TadD
MGDDSGAFEYAERSRARVLGALLASRSGSRRPLFSPAEEERYRALCQRVLDLDLKLEAAQMRGEAPGEELATQLRQALLDESEMVSGARLAAPLPDRLEPAPVITLGELQERLQGLTKNLLVLVYVTTDEAAWLFAVDRRSCELLPLSLPSRELRQRVLAFRRSLGIREVTARHAAASEPPPPPPRDPAAEQRLFTALLGPVRDRLADVEHLCIVPHGSLHYLPFHALHDGQVYLIERFPVSYAPSATMLGLSLERPLGRVDRVLALGNPTSQLRPLGWAALEVKKIAGELRERCRVETETAAERRLLLGPEAAEFDTWHLATHAVFVQSAPHLSYFQLAATSGDDGRVFAFELAGLEKAPRLVIASACQTALTRETPGDEVNGLLYSLLAAGCPAVVGSLWSVADQSTQRLMIRLYQQIQQRDAFDLAAALQQAQIQLLHDHERGTESPYFWAPFVVQGSWSTLSAAPAKAAAVAAETLVVGPGRQAALLVARGEAQLQRAARLWEGFTFTQALEALEAAVESFSSALAVDAETLAGWRGRGLAFLGLDQRDRAAADLSRAVHLAPADPLANAGLALSWGDDPEHWKDALAHLEQAFQVSPRLQVPCPPRNTSWLRSVLRALRAQRVVAKMSRALALTPDDPALWAARGDGYLHLSWSHDAERHRGLAREDYQAALRLDPRHALTRVRLAWLEHSNHRPGAVAVYAQLAREHPDCAEAHLRLAKAQLFVGEATEAVAAFRRALEIDPTLAEGWSGLGEALLGTGDLAGATAAFLEAVDRDPDDSQAHLYLKEIYAAEGRHDDAAREYQECLRTTEHRLYEGRLGVDLRNEVVDWIRSLASRRQRRAPLANQRQLEKLFEEARKLVGEGKTRDALSVYSRILSLDPDNAQALAYRGGAYGQLAEHDRARTDLERAVELDPGSADAWFNLYVLHRDRWQLDRAQEALDRALLLKPELRERLEDRSPQPPGPRAVSLEEALGKAYRTSGLQCAFCERPLRKPTGGLLAVDGNKVDEILAGVPYHCPACGTDSCFQCCAVSALSKVLCKRCGHEMKVWEQRAD